MTSYLMAMALIMIMLTGWIAVQQVYRLFARRHPEFGPYREEGAGCGGGSCACSANKSCSRK